MSSSFTEFRDFGFWSQDWLLESWLRMLALNLPNEVYDLCWLRDLRDQWLLQSAGFFTGFVTPGLDNAISHEDRRALVLASAKSVKLIIDSFDDRVPISYFHAMGIKFVGYYDWVPKQDLESIATRFIDLLEGKIATTASTSPTLPGPWEVPDKTIAKDE